MFYSKLMLVCGILLCNQCAWVAKSWEFGHLMTVASWAWVPKGQVAQYWRTALVAVSFEWYDKKQLKCFHTLEVVVVCSISHLIRYSRYTTIHTWKWWLFIQWTTTTPVWRYTSACSRHIWHWMTLAPICLWHTPSILYLMWLISLLIPGNVTQGGNKGAP